MNKIQDVAKGTDIKAEAKGFNIIEFLLILAARKKLVLGLPLAGAFISAAISLMLPNIYKATSTLLPPQQSQSGVAAVLSQFGGMGRCCRRHCRD